MENNKNDMEQAKLLVKLQITELQLAYQELLEGIDPSSHFDKIKEITQEIRKITGI